ELRGGRRHVCTIDDEGVNGALEAVVEVGIVEQEALKGFPSVLGLEFEMEQTAVVQLEDRVKLFQVDIGDGQIGRDVTNHGRQVEAEAARQRLALPLIEQLERTAIGAVQEGFGEWRGDLRARHHHL